MIININSDNNTFEEFDDDGIITDAGNLEHLILKLLFLSCSRYDEINWKANEVEVNLLDTPEAVI